VTLFSAKDVVVRMQAMEREYSPAVMQKKMSAVGLALTLMALTAVRGLAGWQRSA
jgi:hypothetical protein